MKGLISNALDYSNKLISFITPDFFHLYYLGFVLLSLYSVTWMLSVKMGDATLVNFLWGLSFSLQSIMYLYKSLDYSIFSIFSNKFSWEKVTFTVLLFAHGIRLSAYLILREKGHGEDKRYHKMRERFGRNFWWLSYFLIFLPEMMVNMLMGSLIYAFDNVDKDRINHISYWMGILGMVFGGMLGAFADIQKYIFQTVKRNEGKILDHGLWGLSRHPNYLGEVIFWWGVYLCNFSAGILWTMVGPILFTFMIMFVTGIPVNERILREDHGQEYIDYARRVPIFLPFFGAAESGKASKLEDIVGPGQANQPSENERAKIK